MKKWTSPTIEELDLKYTSTLVTGDELSGEDGEQEEWTCVAKSEDGTIYWDGPAGPGMPANNSWWVNTNSSYWGSK